MDTYRINQLKALLEQQLNLKVTDRLKVVKMSGGAIQENWLIQDDSFALVLRKNSEASVSVSSDREQEYRLLSRLHQLGIKVPEPIYFDQAPNFLNSDFFIMQKVNGTAEGHKLVRLDDVNIRKNITQDIGRSLASIHKVPSDNELTAFLPRPNKDNYLADKIQSFKEHLDSLQATNPILEYAIGWMADNLPSIDELVLVHGDFRTGNIMIENDHVSGILDWEFTQWGDRREDIGWFTAKCWRFGQDKNVAGGIGSYEDFAQAYTDVCGADIPESDLKFWHVLSHVRWAIIAIQQSKRNDDMEIPSLELALTEFMVPKLEKNILDILGSEV
ncbi:phosphotransferase family protein [uncultured Psychrobacter sp.]|uniref:phosphotransferase family protein n=1 Tax=uncultured Psychrobacter sp. TaxID=259303 RepID=UPI0034578CA6